MKYSLDNWVITFPLVILIMSLTIYFIFRYLIFTNNHEEERDVAVVYATLIIKGKREFHAIPVRIKQQVADVLIDMELVELIDEEEYRPVNTAE